MNIILLDKKLSCVCPRCFQCLAHLIRLKQKFAWAQDICYYQYLMVRIENIGCKESTIVSRTNNTGYVHLVDTQRKFALFVASEKRNMRNDICYISRSIQLGRTLPLNLSFKEEQNCRSTYVQLRSQHNRQCLQFATRAINDKKHFTKALFHDQWAKQFSLPRRGN